MKRELACILFVTACASQPIPMSPRERSRGISACDTDIAGNDCLAFGVKLVEHGTPEERALGVTLFERRCASGNAQGCFVLGRHYRIGTSLPLDPDKALSYALRGLEISEARCAEGEHFACYVVSSDYFFGEEVPQDKKKAWVYANKYCALVSSSCADLLPSAYGLSDEEAEALVPKAAD